jgi:hypothetical protein
MKRLQWLLTLAKKALNPTELFNINPTVTVVAMAMAVTAAVTVIVTTLIAIGLVIETTAMKQSEHHDGNDE